MPKIIHIQKYSEIDLTLKKKYLVNFNSQNLHSKENLGHVQ